MNRALELNPNMPSVRLLLAAVYIKLHRYENAIGQLDTYIAENPHSEQIQLVEGIRAKLIKGREPRQ
jgi:predicted Zn-dependent protease